jgi:CheY-like chemotaxis protein
MSDDKPDFASGGTRSGTKPDLSDGISKRPNLESVKFPSSPVLPLRTVQYQSEPVNLVSARKEEQSTRKRLAVLLADDNPVNLAVLQRRLKTMGHEVHSSRDGQQCYELFQRSRNGLDFLLMDLNVSILLTLQTLLTLACRW